MAIRAPIIPQVQEQIRPGARMANAGEGALDPRGMQANVAQASEIIAKEQEKVSYYDALGKYTELKKRMAESQYETVLGENARGLYGKMGEQYRKWVSELSGSLGDPRSQAMFMRKAEEAEVSFLDGIRNHEFRQKNVSEAQKTDAQIETSTDLAIKAGSSGNFGEMERQVADMDQVRRLWSQDRGINPDALERMISVDKSRVYAGAIRSMLDNKNDLAAKGALAKYGDKLLAGDKSQLDRMVKGESTLGEAQREVDKIFTNYVEWETKEEHAIPATEEAAVEEARQIKDPEVRAKAESLTRERWHGLVRSQEAERKKLMVDAVNQIDGGKKYDDLPATLRDSMTATERKQLRNYAKGDRVTDDATWYMLNTMAADERSRGRFKDLNLMNFVDKLDKADFQEVGKLQTALIKGDAKEADGFRDIAGIVSGTIKDAKLSDKDKERFMRVINRQVKDWRAVNKKEKVPDEEVERMTDTLLKKVITDPGWLWDSRDPLYKAVSEADVKAAEKSTDIMRSMKMEDRQKIVNDLKADGVSVTDANILRYYEALLSNRGANAGR